MKKSKEITEVTLLEVCTELFYGFDSTTCASNIFWEVDVVRQEKAEDLEKLIEKLIGTELFREISILYDCFNWLEENEIVESDSNLKISLSKYLLQKHEINERTTLVNYLRN
jgi:hypothetical protein